MEPKVPLCVVGMCLCRHRDRQRNHDGLGSAFSELVAKTADIHLLLVLVCIMIASLILGWVCDYSRLLDLGDRNGAALADVGVPLLSAHLVVFYFGAISAITPPVALAAYAGCGIGNVTRLRLIYGHSLGHRRLIVPYMFIFWETFDLIGSPIEIIIAAITAILGVFTLSIGSVAIS